MLLNKLLFYIITLFLSFKPAFSLPKCLVYDNNHCKICSFDGYNPFLNLSYLGLNLTTVETCLQKNYIILTKNVLILTNSTNPLNFNLSAFDSIYQNLLNAWTNESLLVDSFYESQLNFFLSKGQHFILKNDLAPSNIIFFQRTRIHFKMQPLYCTEYSVQGLCVGEGERPEIILKSIKFMFYVSGTFELRDVNFNAMESIYNNQETGCFSDISLNCCSDFYNPNNISCSLINSTFSSLNQIFLFQLEPIFDDPNIFIPLLNVFNCTFSNFFAIKSQNVVIGGFIGISRLGSNLNINNLTFSNCSFVDGIIQYDSVSFMDETIEQAQGIDDYVLNFIIISNFSVNLSNFNFQNSVSRFLYLKLQPFFYLSSFNGNVVFLNMTFDEIFCLNSTAKFLIFMFSDLKNITFQNIEFQHIQNSVIFSALNVILFVTRFLVHDYFTSDEFVLFFKNSNVNLNFGNFTNFRSSSTLGASLINSLSCNLNLRNSYFENISSFGQTFAYSLVDCDNTIFSNFFMFTSQFFYESSAVLYSNSHFNQVYNFSSLFYFDKCSEVDFVSTKFTNMSGSSFLFSGSTFSLLLINNCSLITLNQLDYVFNPNMMLYTLYSMDSNYEDFQLRSGFLTMIYPSILRFKNNRIINHFFNHSEAYIFLFLNMGDALIVNCIFSNILFFTSGRFVFEMDSGKTTILNSSFINNGWAYLVVPSKIKNIEYNTLFYLWSDTFIALYNCTFRNEGELSLFSGFIETSVSADQVIIDSCSFETYDKREGFHYHGVLLRDAGEVSVTNNLFIGLECSNFSSFIHNNGVLSLQGDSSYLKKTNSKTSVLKNNTFNLCLCQYGGSMAIINYNQTILENIFVTESYSSMKAGAIYLVSLTTFFITNIFISDSKSYKGSALILQSITYGEILNGFINKTRGEVSGSILIDKSIVVKLLNFRVFQSYSNQNGGFLILKGGELYLIDSFFFKCESAIFGGGLYLLNNGILHIQNLTAYNCSSNSVGGFLHLDLCNFAIIYNLTLINMTALLKGAAIFINTIQYFEGENWLLQDCSVPDIGTIFITNSEKLAFIAIQNVVAINNKAKSGSFIYGEAYINLNISNLLCVSHANNTIFFMWNFPIDIILTNITLSQVISEGDLLFFSGIDFILINIELQVCTIGSHVITIETSLNAEIHNLIFKDNILLSKTQAQILTVSSSILFCQDIFLIYPNQTFFSLLSGKDSNITVNAAYLDSVLCANTSLIYLENSQLILVNSFFSNNNGPALLIYDTNCSILNSHFFNNHKSDNYDTTNIISTIKYTKKNVLLSIFNSTFDNSEGSSILLSNIFEISLILSSFLGNNKTKGLILNEFSLFSIKSSNFQNFVGEKGSSLILDCTYARYDNSSIEISNTIFSQNVANFGGAIYLIGINNISIFNSSFLNNKAILSNELNKYGVGGVMIIKGTNNIQCYNYLKDCHFFNNSAEEFIQTIFSTCYLHIENVTIDNLNFTSKFDNTTIFLRNSTNMGSINFSTSSIISNFPLKIIAHTKNDTLIENFDDIEIIPGVSFNISFLLLDEFNQVLNQENQFYGRLIHISSNVSVSDLSLKNSDSSRTTVGFLNFTNILIKTIPNSYFYLQLNVEVSDFDFDYYQFTQIFQFYARSCRKGEIYDRKVVQCYECPLGYFSLIDPMNSAIQNQMCYACVSNAICPGKFYLVPSSGFWRMNNESYIIVSCPISNACLGTNGYDDSFSLKTLLDNNDFDSLSNNIDLIHGTCVEGHHKNLCNDCMFGYGKFNYQSLCQKCENIRVLLILRLAVTIFFLTVYLLLNAKLLVENDSQIIDVVSKIFFNHLQKINIVVFFSISDMIPDFQVFMSLVNTVSFLNEDIIINDCFMQGANNNTDYTYLYKVISSLFFPILSSILPLLILLVMEFYQRKFKRIATADFALRNKISLMFLISIFLFYPLIMKCSLSTLNCISLNKNELFLYMSPNVKCWGSEHIIFLTIIGIFGIFGWGFFFPVFLSFYLKKKFAIKQKMIHYALKESTNKTSISLIEDKTVNFLKFFYKDYKSNLFFWESIIFLEKFALSVILYCNQLIQDEYVNLIFLLILLIYLLAFSKIQPYKIKYMNNLEYISTIIAIITKLLIIIQTDKNLKVFAIKVSFSILVIALNSLFSLLAVYYIVKLTRWKELYYGTMKRVSAIAKKINELRRIDPTKMRMSVTAKIEKK